MAEQADDFTTTEHNGVFTIGARPDLEIDLTRRDEFAKVVGSALASAACSSLVVDLSEAGFMDCYSTNVLLEAGQKLRAANKPLVVDIAGYRTATIRRLFQVIGAEEAFFVVNEMPPIPGILLE